MLRVLFSLLTVVCFGFVPPCQAALTTLHDEAVDGDLSDNSGSSGEFTTGEPTQLGLLSPTPGIGFEEFRVRGDTDSFAGDFFTIEIGNGHQLQSILFTDITYVDSDSTDNGMFLGISSGDTFANSYDEVNDDFFPGFAGPPVGDNWLGGALIGRSVEGDDILPLILGNANFGAEILSAPLPPGQYTFLVQQTGDPNSYTLDFGVGVTAIAEPSSLMGLGGAAAFMAWRRRRRAVSPPATNS